MPSPCALPSPCTLRLASALNPAPNLRTTRARASAVRGPGVHRRPATVRMPPQGWVRSVGKPSPSPDLPVCPPSLPGRMRACNASSAPRRSARAASSQRVRHGLGPWGRRSRANAVGTCAHGTAALQARWSCGAGHGGTTMRMRRPAKLRARPSGRAATLPRAVPRTTRTTRPAGTGCGGRRVRRACARRRSSRDSSSLPPTRPR